MRHRVKTKALSRNTKQRKALFKGLLSSLFEHGAIETTETKAKIIRRLADKVVTKAMPRTLNARRTLEQFFGSKQIVNRIVDGVVPALSDRHSGFTTLTRLGRRRGDDAAMVKLELVHPPIEATSEVEKSSTEKKEVKVAAKPAVKAEDKATPSSVKKVQKKAAVSKTTVKKSAPKKAVAK
jgi:large subunit ribosomal protein L17